MPVASKSIAYSVKLIFNFLRTEKSIQITSVGKDRGKCVVLLVKSVYSLKLRQRKDSTGHIIDSTLFK